MSRIQHGLGKALVGASVALSVSLPLCAAERQADILYNFNGRGDGKSPRASLIMDAAGNFYGAAAHHIFKLSPLGVESTLYTFKGQTDGAAPNTRLVLDAAGNLYGTTTVGGAHNFGVVYKLTPDGQETVLHSFAGGRDGKYPGTGMVMDGAGALYGTTGEGGAGSGGTVFKVAPDGTETVLHAFSGPDGGDPYGDLFLSKKGAIHGVTLFGGANDAGVIFDISPSGTFSVRYTFTGGADGAEPWGGVIEDRQGVLYGTTYTGPGSSRLGEVFKLAPDGALTVLHAFTGAPDAQSPTNSLVMDGDGNLFGIAPGGVSGRGAVYEVSPDGTETIVHSFAGSPDGDQPYGSLVFYMNKLYGVTAFGGTGTGQACGSSGCGTVYEVRRAK